MGATRGNLEQLVNSSLSFTYDTKIQRNTFAKTPKSGQRVRQGIEAESKQQ